MKELFGNKEMGNEEEWLVVVSRGVMGGGWGKIVLLQGRISIPVNHKVQTSVMDVQPRASSSSVSK